MSMNVANQIIYAVSGNNYYYKLIEEIDQCWIAIL